MRYMLGTLILALASIGSILLPPDADAASTAVSCPGGSINKALQLPQAPLIIVVSGTCTENVIVTRDDVTIQAEPGAIIAAADTGQPAILLDGAHRVEILGLTVLGGAGGIVGTGGATFDVAGPGCLVEGQSLRGGVLAAYGSVGTVHGCLVQNVTGDGVVAANGASLVVTDSVIQNNTRAGAVAVRNSHLRLGQDAGGSPVIRPVTITGNGTNGILLTESSAGVVVGGSVTGSGTSAVFVGRGSSAQVGIDGGGSLVAGTTVQANAGTGISIEGGNATVLASTISGNGGSGIIVANGGSARIGIRNDNTGYAGNTITMNGRDGVAVVHGGAALIGGNTIQSNGTNTSAQFRFGVVVSRATATLVGGNTIHGHPNSGVFVGSGGSARIGDTGFGLPIGNTISGNGGTGDPSTRSGVFAFQGGVVEVRGAAITGNFGSGATAFENAVIELREGTVVHGNVPSTPTASDGHGVTGGFRSVLRFRDPGTTLSGNAGDGVQLFSGSVVDFRAPGPGESAVSVTGNGGFGLRCLAETYYSGTVTGVAGNAAGGNVDPSGSVPGCVRF